MEKMLSRVQSATMDGMGRDFTNDITSDPMAQFAVVFAALIHDVDHPGVSNAQLVQEQDDMAVRYDGRSPAENHSLNLAWDKLMQPEFQDLVLCICGSSTGAPNRGSLKGVSKEVRRLRQLIENAVLATDVFDPELKQDRDVRWARVFNNDKVSESCCADDDESQFDRNPEESIEHLKATIVLEHLIQASDVAHTMQHWVSLIDGGGYVERFVQILFSFLGAEVLFIPYIFH